MRMLTSAALRTCKVEASPRDMRRVMMRGRKVAAWKRLSVPERDVLTVLSAICKARHPARPSLSRFRVFIPSRACGACCTQHADGCRLAPLPGGVHVLTLLGAVMAA